MMGLSSSLVQTRGILVAKDEVTVGAAKKEHGSEITQGKQTGIG